MKKLIMSLTILCSLQSYARSLEFKSKFNLFSQELGSAFSMPVQLSPKTELNIKFEIPTSTGPTLRKVFSQAFDVEDLKAVFEIYYFDQMNQKYLSQQIFLYKGSELITRCTSYFGLDQTYLVPGSCAGNKEGKLYGFALYKN